MILIIGYKLSVGIAPYLEQVVENLQKKGELVLSAGEKFDVLNSHVRLSNGGRSFQMILDTLNPTIYYHFYSLLKKNKPKSVFFIGSHSLNVISILILKLFFSKIKIVSQIHDPYPHTGTSYKGIILFSQRVQVKLSDIIIVAGEKLKQEVKSIYKIYENKIKVAHLGCHRKYNSNYIDFTDRKLISVLGRIEEYKGIDIFLESIKIIQKQRKNFKYKFIIGGGGDFLPYQVEAKPLIENNLLQVINRFITDDEFDDILKKSAICILPYKDGTQTGTTQIAYYNSCPVIVTNVGSLPELIDNGKTGLVIEPSNAQQLANSILELTNNKEILEKMGINAFRYYEEKFQWSILINEYIKILK